MGFLDFWKRTDINEALTGFTADPNAVLLDVRTEEEYAEGRIPHSRNIPLDQLQRVRQEVEDLDTPLYLYCHSGARSRVATEQLRRMGYTNLHDLGGIMSYRGKVER